MSFTFEIACLRAEVWPEAESWWKTLVELGHELQTDNLG
jgi:hypothetical protein